MTILRTTARWAGFAGAPGYTNFFFQAGGEFGDPTGAASKTQQFFNTIKAVLPGSVNVTVIGEVAEIDEVTGQATTFHSVTQAAPYAGAAVSGAYAGPSGGCINWITGGVVNGKRVRGRTFIVPMASETYTNAGVLTTSAMNTLTTAAGVLSNPDAAQLVVWSRPDTATGRTGSAHVVTSSRVLNKVAVLTSRRD